MPETTDFVDGIEASLRANLKAQRERLGFSQADLARRASEAGLKGMHQTTIARIEKGDRPLKAAEALTIARLLNTSLEFLAEGVDAAYLRTLGSELNQRAIDISQNIDTLTHQRLTLARLLDGVERGESPTGGTLSEEIDPSLLLMLEITVDSSTPTNRTLMSYMGFVRNGSINDEGLYPDSVGRHEAKLYEEMRQTLANHPDFRSSIRGNDGEH